MAQISVQRTILAHGHNIVAQPLMLAGRRVENGVSQIKGYLKRQDSLTRDSRVIDFQIAGGRPCLIAGTGHDLIHTPLCLLWSAGCWPIHTMPLRRTGYAVCRSPCVSWKKAQDASIYIPRPYVPVTLPPVMQTRLATPRVPDGFSAGRAY